MTTADTIGNELEIVNNCLSSITRDAAYAAGTAERALQCLDSIHDLLSALESLLRLLCTPGLATKRGIGSMGDPWSIPEFKAAMLAIGKAHGMDLSAPEAWLSVLDRLKEKPEHVVEITG